MSHQKIKPCPNCRTSDQMAVYTYDSGGRHVECMKCQYFGPGEGSIKQAIISHNERVSKP